MKKILLLTVAMLSATMMNAGLGLSVEGYFIDKDTTITITHVEENEADGELIMEWKGLMLYKGELTVMIDRVSPCREEGFEDQFCAGNCQTGTAGAVRDTMSFNLSIYEKDKNPIQVYAHYYPEDRTTLQIISYRFIGDGDDFTLTVNYAPDPMAVAQNANKVKSVKKMVNGQMLIVRDGKAYNLLGAKL